MMEGSKRSSFDFKKALKERRGYEKKTSRGTAGTTRDRYRQENRSADPTERKGGQESPAAAGTHGEDSRNLDCTVLQW